jgi:DNA-binding transcriptional LysR family regulator
VRLVTRDSDVVRSLLPSESFDIGIAELPINDVEVKVSRFRLRCVAVLPSHHELAGTGILSPAHLSGTPFVTTFRARLVHHCVRRAFADAGCDWNVCAETEFFASACGLVASGAGVAVVDPYTAANFAKLGLISRAFEPAVFYEIGLFHSLEREPSVIARSFLDLLSQRLADIAE